jgi:hypothetical protein
LIAKAEISLVAIAGDSKLFDAESHQYSNLHYYDYAYLQQYCRKSCKIAIESEL